MDLQLAAGIFAKSAVQGVFAVFFSSAGSSAVTGAAKSVFTTVLNMFKVLFSDVPVFFNKIGRLCNSEHSTLHP